MSNLNGMIDFDMFIVLLITLLMVLRLRLPSVICMVSDIFLTLPRTFVTSDMALPNTLF